MSQQCKNCGDEHELGDMWDGHCSDGCQVEYINEHFRDDSGDPIY